ncbi:helix-turn-helix domain-containing protein, partial [Lysobacter maris]
MNATKKLLDKWMEWRSASNGGPLTQKELAKELGVGQTSISNYKVGVSQAAPHVISKMARDLGESEAAWLALVESERARDGEDRRAWARIARQLGAAASIAVVALMVFPAPAKATVAANLNGNTPYALCE